MFERTFNYKLSHNDAKSRRNGWIWLIVTIFFIVQLSPTPTALAVGSYSNISTSSPPPLPVIEGALQELVRADENLVLPDGLKAEITAEAGSASAEDGKINNKVIDAVVGEAAAHIAVTDGPVVVESDLPKAETDTFISEHPALAKALKEHRAQTVLVEDSPSNQQLSQNYGTGLRGAFARIANKWRLRVKAAGLPSHPGLSRSDRIEGAGWAVARTGISAGVYFFIKDVPLQPLALAALTGGALSILFNATNIYHVASDAGYMGLNQTWFKQFLARLGLKKVVASVSSYYEFTSAVTWLSYSFLTTTLYWQMGVSPQIFWTAVAGFATSFFYSRALYRWIRFENPPPRLVKVMFRFAWIRSFFMSILGPFIIAGHNDPTSNRFILGTILTGLTIYIGTHNAVRIHLGRATQGLVNQLRIAWSKFSAKSAASTVPCAEILNVPQINQITQSDGANSPQN